MYFSSSPNVNCQLANCLCFPWDIKFTSTLEGRSWWTPCSRFQWQTVFSLQVCFFLCHRLKAFINKPGWNNREKKSKQKKKQSKKGMEDTDTRAVQRPENACIIVGSKQGHWKWWSCGFATEWMHQVAKTSDSLGAVTCTCMAEGWEKKKYEMVAHAQLMMKWSLTCCSAVCLRLWWTGAESAKSRVLTSTMPTLSSLHLLNPCFRAAPFY